jgi:hypothetical protein
MDRNDWLTIAILLGSLAAAAYYGLEIPWWVWGF